VAASLAIFASYLLAVFLIPSFCARFLRREDIARESSDENEEKGFGKLYSQLLQISLRFRYPVIALVALAFTGAVILLVNMGTELFPQVDAKQMTVFVRLPSGTRIEVTEKTVADIEKTLIELIGQPDPEYPRIEQFPDSDLQILISNIGVLMDWPAAYTPNTGPMDAFMLVQLKGKYASTFDYVDRLRAQLSSRFPAVEFSFDTGGMLTAALNFGEPSPIHIQVSGSNVYTSHEIAQIIRSEAAQVPGAVDVRIAQRLDYPIIDIEVDRIKAALSGLTVDDVMKNIVTATNSSINFDPAFWIDNSNGNHYFIGAQYAEKDIRSLETLKDIPITGENSSQSVALRNLATFSQRTGPAVITHRNITRVVDIYVNTRQGYDVGSVVAAIEHRLENSTVLGLALRDSERGTYYEVAGSDYSGKGYGIDLMGEVRSMRESFAQFGKGLLIATILVYLVMVAQFRNFLDPFVIMLTVPLGFIGVVGVLFLTGTALSIQSFMGIIMMVGIVVEYSIILVDFANSQVGENLTPREAIVRAARIRLRPILMTSITTILALIPMAIGIGGGDANVPLARAIVGGVVAAAVLSLLVVPCFYVILKRVPVSSGEASGFPLK
jgi:multidrug efflux pump subunit AcrB